MEAKPEERPVADQRGSEVEILQPLTRPPSPSSAESSSRVHLDVDSRRDRDRVAEREREQSLGSKKSRKRVIRPSERFRFSFDWENTQDTIREMNMLYQSPHEARLLYGREWLP